MKIAITSALISLFLIVCAFCSDAQQLSLKVVAGNLMIGDGSPVFDKAKYARILDSITRNAATNHVDTNRLFKTALLYDLLNNQLSKPSPGEQSALRNLIKAKDSLEQAITLNMRQLNVRILRAQIYRDLCYRYSGDQSWMFNSQIIAHRRKEFDLYKSLSNQSYQDLQSMDKNNASDYEKLKVNYNYPVK